MKKKYNSFPGILLILTICAVLLFLLVRQSSPFGKNNSAFSVSEKTRITRVALYENGNKLVLEKKGNDWTIKGGIETRPGAVSLLDMVLREMQVKSTVSPELFSQAVTGGADPVRVHVYSGWRLKRSFFVYRTSSNTYGNIMKMRVSSRPFIMYVPGFEADIGSLFTADPLYWQPYLAFSIMPSELKCVEVRNPGDTTLSFRICTGGQMLTFESPALNETVRPDTSRMKRYLSYYSYVPFEAWEKGLTPGETDEIISSRPLYIISAIKKDGTIRTLTVWEKHITDAGGKEIKDPDRVWGKTGESRGLVVIRYFDLDPILRDAPYFFMD